MDLTDLLDIVRNEKLYTKRIEELQNLEANAKAATDKLTKARDIDAALANAKRAEQTANDMLKEAREKYQESANDAAANASLIRMRAIEDADKIKTAVSDKRNELDALTQQLDAVTKQLDASQREIANAKAELASVNAESSRLREDVKKKQQQLKELLSG